MVCDLWPRLVESGYCRYTSFVVRQDIDANPFVGAKHHPYWRQHFFDPKIKIDAKYICFHMTYFVKIVCIMRRQENGKRSAVTMSLAGILFAKGGPQIKTHLSQEQVNI